MLNRLKIALVHDFLNQSGGAEQVLRQIHNLFPEAPVFTLVYNKNRVPEDFNSWNIEPVGWSQRLPKMHKWYKYYMPLYPTMIEQIDLREFDLVLSSSYLVAKGVLTRSQTLHLCYCHTPMRQAWELYFDYKHGYTKSGFKPKRELFKFFYPIVLNYVRMWDRLAADRVDHFACNSLTTKKRIEKFYRRESRLIYPPVNVGKFRDVAVSDGDYFLCLSRLVPYKRIDLAVEAFNRKGARLIIAGDGPQIKHLKKAARDNIEFVGRIDENRKLELMAGCRALIFPGREDFGIVPVEAQASGKPVIAYGAGGATESVIDDQTGILFPEQTADSLLEALQKFEQIEFDPDNAHQSALRFDISTFARNYINWVEEKADQFFS